MSQREDLFSAVVVAGVQQGLPRLESLLAGVNAGVGGDDWRTDRARQAILHELTGRTYHLESIGRSRRGLARRGFIESTRIYTGQLPSPAAKYKSAHGTTRSRLNWKAFNLRPPSKAQRKRARATQNARAYEAVAVPVARKNDYAEPAGPAPTARFSAPAPRSPSPPPSVPAPTLTGDLAAIAARVGARIEARESRREAAEDEAAVLAAERARAARPPPPE